MKNNLLIPLFLLSLNVLAEEEQVYVSKDAIVVTAAGYAQQIKDAPASISVIEKEELENKSYRDLTDALKGVEGISIVGSGAQASGSGQDITIRGMPGQYTLILVDGKRQNSRETRLNGNAGFEQGWLPPLEAIERIEIVRGPMSSLYGSDAIGGVVNVITKKISDKWGGSARLESTVTENSKAGDSLGGNFYLSGPAIKDKLGFSLWGNYFHRDEDNIANGYNKAVSHNITARVSAKINENHTVMADFGTASQDVTTRLGKSSPEGMGGTSGTSTELENNRKNGSLTHYGQWGKVSSEITLTQENIERDSKNLVTGLASTPNKATNRVANAKVMIPFERHYITAGAEWREDDLNLTGYLRRECINPGGCTQASPPSHYQAVTNQIDLKVNQKAIYLEDEISLTNKLTFTAGVRADNHEVYGTELVPRGYLVYQLNNSITLKGGVSKGYKAPSPRQVLSEYASVSGGATGGGRIAIVGNPDLKPEKSINQEVAVFYSPSKAFSTGLTFFQNDFKNKFSEVNRPDMQDRFPGATIRQSINVSEARIKGLEASMTIAPIEKIILKSSYTLIDSKITKDDVNNQTGRPLSGTPKQTISNTITWLPTLKVNLWVTHNYYSERVMLGRANALPTTSPKYSMLDLGGSYQFTNDYSVSFAVYNITNKVFDYEEDNYYIDGRRFWLALNAKF